MINFIKKIIVFSLSGLFLYWLINGLKENNMYNILFVLMSVVSTTMLNAFLEGLFGVIDKPIMTKRDYINLLQLIVVILAIILAIGFFFSPIYFALKHSPAYFLLFLLSWVPMSATAVGGAALCDLLEELK